MCDIKFLYVTLKWTTGQHCKFVTTIKKKTHTHTQNSNKHIFMELQTNNPPKFSLMTFNSSRMDN